MAGSMGGGIPELTNRVDKLERTMSALLQLLHDRRLIADDDMADYGDAAAGEDPVRKS